MKSHAIQFAGAALALAGVAWLASSTPAGESQPAAYTFRSAPVNSLGIKSLEDLRGHPVLIEFWGKN